MTNKSIDSQTTGKRIIWVMTNKSIDSPTTKGTKVFFFFFGSTKSTKVHSGEILIQFNIDHCRQYILTLIKISN